MTPTQYVPLGRVVKTHGLKGEVSVVPATSLPFVLPEGLEVWFVPPPAGVRSGRIVSVRPGPKGPLVTIEGVSDPDAAAALRGCELLARSEDLPAAWLDGADNNLDPVGVAVYDEDRGLLGHVAEVIVTGANDVWVVDGRFGSVLLPVIDDVMLEYDESARRADVRLLPGLMPDEEESA